MDQAYMFLNITELLASCTMCVAIKSMLLLLILQAFSEGLANKMRRFHVMSDSDKDDAIVVRIHGTVFADFRDRHQEFLTMQVRLFHWPLTRYVKLRVVDALWMPGTFSPPPLVSDPDMHHGTCVTHVPWCMPGLLTSGFLWSRWRGKHSPHSRRMRNPQLCVSGKRPMDTVNWGGR